MNPFAHLVTVMKNQNTTKKTISSTEYESFRKEYLFEQLKGIAFGKAFCKKFKIDDYILSSLNSTDTAIEWVNDSGYVV